MESSFEKGNNFEIYIESIYQGLGYKTKRDVNVFGQQIDIVATKSLKGLGPITLIIECKYLAKGSISNQIVMNFQNYLSSIKDKYSFAKAIIVTNQKFSSDAKLNANDNLSLITLSELENELFELKESYISFIKQYESEDIFNEYIPLSAEINDEPIINVEDSIFNSLKNILYNAEPAFYSILGDYGSGKTTLLTRLYYRFCKDYIQNNETIKPFYVELKEYHKFKNIELFIIASYQKQFQKEITFKAFNRELANRGFLLLLDGFDEMSPQVNKEKRLEDFGVLADLLFSNSHCILTCRPSYFVSSSQYWYFITGEYELTNRQIIKENSKKLTDRVKQENINKTYRRLHDLYIKKKSNKKEIEKSILTINLQELSENQVFLYLDKFNEQFIAHCKSSTEEIKSFLDDIYDLSELMTKPLLLSMIKDTILANGEDYRSFRSEYGPAYLYEMYTEINLDYDWSKGKTRQYLSKEERREFATAIALSMFETTTLDVDYKTILNVVNNYKINLKAIEKKLLNMDTEAIASDVQICTFITRSDDFKFKFIHTSFMEFFIAKYLKTKLENGELDEKLKSTYLKSEILLFIGSFYLNNTAFLNKLLNILRQESNEILKRNLAIIYMCSKPEHNNIDFRHVNFVEARFSKMNLDNFKFIEVQFKKVHLKNVTIDSSTFLNVSFYESQLVNFTLTQSKGLILFHNLSATNFSVRNKNFENLLTFELYNSELINLTILETRVKVLFDNIVLKDSTLIKSKIELAGLSKTSRNTLTCDNLLIENTNLTGKITRLDGSIKLLYSVFDNFEVSGTSDYSKLYISKSNFSNCKLRNCNLKVTESRTIIKDSILNNCIISTEGDTDLEFINCQFINCQFTKNRRGFNCSLINCLFSESSIEVVSVKSFEGNKIDNETRGLIVTGNSFVSNNFIFRKSEKIKCLNEITNKLYLIKDNDLNMNNTSVNSLLQINGIFVGTH